MSSGSKKKKIPFIHQYQKNALKEDFLVDQFYSGEKEKVWKWYLGFLNFTKEVNDSIGLGGGQHSKGFGI